MPQKKTMPTPEPNEDVLKVLKEFTDTKGFTVEFTEGGFKQRGARSEDLWKAMQLVEMRKLNEQLHWLTKAITGKQMR